MTGLERWMRENNTSIVEITALITASGMAAGDVLDDTVRADPMPTGRAAALEAMLARGRNGDMDVDVEAFATLAGRDVEAVRTAIDTNPDSYANDVTVENGVTVSINSRALPALVQELEVGLPDASEAGQEIPDGAPADGDGDGASGDGGQEGAPADGNDDDPEDGDGAPAQEGTAGQPVPQSGAKPAKNRGKNKPVENPPLKMAPRRKTKYSVNKGVAIDLLKAEEHALTGKDLRTFLLSLPEYKPNDVALMDDKAVDETIEKNFVQVRLGGGVVFMSDGAYQSILCALTANDSYYIPVEQPAAEEA